MKTYKVKVNGKTYEVVLEAVSETASAPVSAASPAVEAPKAAPVVATGDGVIAPIAGKLVKFNVKVGDTIKKGDIVAVIEAMKLENEVPTPFAGTVKNICVKTGDHVENGTLIIELA